MVSPSKSNSAYTQRGDGYFTDSSDDEEADKFFTLQEEENEDEPENVQSWTNVGSNYQKKSSKPPKNPPLNPFTKHPMSKISEFVEEDQIEPISDMSEFSDTETEVTLPCSTDSGTLNSSSTVVDEAAENLQRVFSPKIEESRRRSQESEDPWRRNEESRRRSHESENPWRRPDAAQSSSSRFQHQGKRRGSYRGNDFRTRPNFSNGQNGDCRPSNDRPRQSFNSNRTSSDGPRHRFNGNARLHNRQANYRPPQSFAQNDRDQERPRQFPSNAPTRPRNLSFPGSLQEFFKIYEKAGQFLSDDMAKNEYYPVDAHVSRTTMEEFHKDYYKNFVTLKFEAGIKSVAAELLAMMRINQVVALKLDGKEYAFRILHKNLPFENVFPEFSAILGQIFAAHPLLDLPETPMKFPFGRLQIREAFDSKTHEKEKNILLNQLALLDIDGNGGPNEHLILQRAPPEMEDLFKNFYPAEYLTRSFKFDDVVQRDEKKIRENITKLSSTFPLTQDQIFALEQSLVRGLSLITGDSATGKTTVAACFALMSTILGDEKVLCIAPNEHSAEALHEKIMKLMSKCQKWLSKVRVKYLWDREHLKEVLKMKSVLNEECDILITTPFYGIHNCMEAFLPSFVVFDESSQFHIGQVAACIAKARLKSVNGSRVIRSILVVGDKFSTPPSVPKELKDDKDVYEVLTHSVLFTCLNANVRSFALRQEFRGFHAEFDMSDSLLKFDLIKNSSGEEPLALELRQNEWVSDPVLWFHVGGKEEKHTYSYSNKAEADAIAKLLDRIKEMNVEPPDVGVITLFQDQKIRLLSKLASTGHSDIAILSGVEAEGKEFPIVILSLVRTMPSKTDQRLNGTQFKPSSKQYRRNAILKLVMTRATRSLYIVGDLYSMIHFGGDMGNLAKNCKERRIVNERYI